jgi:hypothetical protein
MTREVKGAFWEYFLLKTIGVIKMVVERIILIAIWVITIIGLLYLVPRNKIREAHVIFLFKQVITWISGLLVVEFHLIEYPVRVFKIATTTSFTFEYFVYPALCVIFNLHFPEKKGWIARTSWYIFFPTWMTIIEVLLEKYTNLIDYLLWTWYYTWLTLLITFFITRKYYLWFYRKTDN